MSDEPKPSLGSRIKSIFFHNGGESPAAPTDSTFQKLAGAMPAMFKQLRDRKRKARLTTMEEAIKSGVKLPCCICGKHFGSTKVVLGLEAQLKHFCPKCKKRLDAGETALVTMDGKRFRFVKFSTEKQADLVGKMVTVKVSTMDEIERKEAKKNAN